MAKRISRPATSGPGSVKGLEPLLKYAEVTADNTGRMAGHAGKQAKELERVADSLDQFAPAASDSVAGLHNAVAFGFGTSNESVLNARTVVPGDSVSERVRSTLRAILGARVRSDDPAGFLTALRRTFVPEEHNGTTVYRRIPQSTVLQSESGILTGPQKSLHDRAARALQHSNELLASLRPLSCKCSAEEFESARELVRSTFAELVGELGKLGGPRIPRVDELLEALLGTDGPPNRPESEKGQMEHLRKEMGFDSYAVCTVEDEMLATSLNMVEDYLRALQANWNTEKGDSRFQRSGTQGYLASVRFHLSRHLAVLHESAVGVRAVLAGLTMGPGEQETFLIKVNDPNEQLYLAEFLDWIEHVAAVEGPRLIRDGGCFGATVLVRTLVRLKGLADQAQRIAEAGNPNPGTPSPFFATQSRVAIRELARQLGEARDVAQQLNSILS